MTTGVTTEGFLSASAGEVAPVANRTTAPASVVARHGETADLFPSRLGFSASDTYGPDSYGPEAYGLLSSWSRPDGSAPHPARGRGPGEELRSPVLVVDDDRAIRDSLRMVLEDAGYGVVEASDGVEAIGMLRGAGRPMVVLLDIMMPRMSGEEVVGEIARDPRLQATHSIVVITANRHNLSRPFLAQLDRLRIPILDKPPDIDDVIAHVTRAEQRLADQG